MQANPGITINLTLSDELIDLVAGGYDLAIRIGELTDSSLVARRLAPVRRLLCASPDYVATHGMPKTLADLDRHICLPPHNNDTWRLEGPEGPVIYRPHGPLITNSSEVIREAVLAGLGIALRSTWDVGPELKIGRLVPVLPFLEAPKNVALSAVYPSREFLPAKVRLFIDYLTSLYGLRPYWEG
jgi:DNA-binding transcriptional LysR family regulator